MLKQKYFQNGQLLESTAVPRSRYIWRSLCRAIELIKDSLFWRVGNGSQINVWKHQWVPIPSSYKIQSPISILREVAKVKELIDADNGEWNQEPIYQIFNPDEAAIICRLPTSRSNAIDKLIWRPSSKGTFTVKPTYYLELQRFKNHFGDYSTSGNDNKYWRTILELKTPGFVKHFLWKASQNVLPTKKILFKKSILPNSTCPICTMEEENVSHVLWSCLVAANVWSYEQFSLTK